MRNKKGREKPYTGKENDDNYKAVAITTTAANRPNIIILEKKNKKRRKYWPIYVSKRNPNRNSKHTDKKCTNE